MSIKQFLPIRCKNRVSILIVAFAFVMCGSALAQDPPANSERASANRIRYRSTNNQFNDVDAEWLSGWLRRFGVQLPDDIRGKITTDLEIQWPFGALTNPKEYRIRATIESDRLQVGPLTLGDVDADIDYRKGVAVLKRLSFNLLEDIEADGNTKTVVRGNVEGTAAAQLLPLDLITLDIRFKDLEATYIANELDVEVPELTGKLSGEAHAESDFDSFRTIKGWKAEGKLNGKDLSALGRPTSELRETKLTLKDGQLRLQEFVLETEGGLVRADGQIDLANAFPWQLKTRLEKFELSEAAKWAGVNELDASGKVTGQLDLDGTVSPFVWKAQGALDTNAALVEQIRFTDGNVTVDASGTNEAADLRAEGTGVAKSVRGPALGQGRINSVTAKYRLNDNVVELTELNGKLGDGALQAKATWPLTDDGIAKADGNWQDLDLGPFLLSSDRRKNLSIAAKSEGEFRWSAPINSLDDLSQHQLSGKADVPNVIVNGEPSGKVSLDISQSEGADPTIQYQLAGDIFGGTIEGSGTLSSLREQTSFANEGQAASDDDPRSPKISVPNNDANKNAKANGNGNGAGTTSSPLGNLQLKDVDLARFAQTVLRDTERTWQGRLSLSAEIDGDGTSSGQLEVARLQYVDSLITDLLKADFKADSKQIQLERMAGRVLGGRLSSQGRFDYSGRGQLGIQLNRIDTGRIAKLFYPWLEDYFDGDVDVSLRATGSDAWRATGTVTGVKNKIGVFDIQRLRAPVIVALRPSGTISLESRDIRGSLAKGRIAGKGKVVSRSSGIDLASQWKFSQVGIQSIEDALGGSGAIASGDMTGTMTLSGKRMRAFRDVKGALRVEFHDAGARSLPLINQLQRFVIGTNLNATKFTTGQMIATLGKGQVNVEDLRLVSPQLAMFAKGKYAPFTNRIDLDVTASTAEGTARNTARRVLVNRLSVITPVTATLANVNELISDRVVQVHVGGTIRSPHFTLRPCPTLQQEVVRFFLRQLTAEFIDVEF